MALLTILRINFVTSAAPPFVAGDVIETQWETTTQQFSVTKNGVDYPQAGSSIIQVTDDLAANGLDLSFRTVSLLVPSTCVYTSLWSFSLRKSGEYTGRTNGTNDWPYCEASETPNSNVCSPTPVVNDLAWSSPKPLRKHASTAISNDGQVTYIATSSNGTVMYSLTASTSKFPVFDNSTGSFINLTAGSYKIWAQDGAGFLIWHTFEILNLSAEPPPPPIETPSIYFSGSPTIGQDTGPGDGSITYTAVSNNPPIQYALRDFVYGDGSGQASSTFSNLRAGSYFLWAIDSVNAKAGYSFTIPLNTTPSTPPAGTPNYDIKYQLQVTDLNNKLSVVNITEKNLVGSTTQVDGGSDDPIVYSLRLHGNDDKYASVAASTLTLTLNSATAGQFQELFLGKIDDYRVNFYQEGLLKLTAKIYPQSYREPYTEAVNYPVTITATDGLVELDDLDFVDDNGLYITGRASQIEVIALILQKLNFNIGIRVACNLYADGMTTGAANDPLEQAYVDCRSYYPNDEPLSCLEVIRRIIEPYCATIIQWQGYWWIVRFEEFISTSVPYREYDYTGDYRSNGSHNPIVNVKATNLYDRLHWTGEVFLDMVQPFGNIEVIYKQGLLRSLLKNGDFKITYNTGADGVKKANCDLSSFNFVQNGDTYFSANFVKANEFELGQEPTNGAIAINGTGLGYIMTQVANFSLAGSDRLNISIKVRLNPWLIDFPYQKVKVQVQHGSLYLQQDGTWTSAASYIVHYVKESGKYVELKTNAQASGVLNGLLTMKVFSSYVWEGEFSGLSYATMKTKATVDLPTGYRTELTNNTTTDLVIAYYELENNTASESVPDIVRPNDYHAATNPYQWIRKSVKSATISAGTFMASGTMTIDYITLTYAPADAELPEDKVSSVIPKATRSKLTRTIYHGSAPKQIEAIFTAINFSGNLVVTPLWFANPNFALTHINYLRSSAGVPWEKWVRDAVDEDLELQNIVMQSYAAQYKQASRRLTGSLSNIPVGGSPVYLSPVSVIKDNHDGRFYRPMGYSHHVRQCLYDGEFIEIFDITAGGTSTGGGTRTFNNTFNSTFR